jgi:ketosteroid isomerase-like protein
MATTPETQIVESIYRAFGAGDVPGVLARFGPDVEWRTPASLPWSEGTYRGPEGVARYFTSFLEHLDRPSIEPESVVAAGEEVIARGFERATVRSTGRPFEARFVHIWRLDGDRIASMEGLVDTATVVAAFGAD